MTVPTICAIFRVAAALIPNDVYDRACAIRLVEAAGIDCVLGVSSNSARANGVRRSGMRRGYFEKQEDPNGRIVYRLRWYDRSEPLTALETVRGAFIRYLIERGKLSEFDDVPDRS